MYEYLLLVMIVVVVIVLIITEYQEHDGKLQYPIIDPRISTQEIFTDIYLSLRKCSDFIIWRQALIASIIATTLIILLLFQRIPCLAEVIIISLLIFLAVYFAFSWMRIHFHLPIIIQIRKGIFLLEERLNSNGV